MEGSCRRARPLLCCGLAGLGFLTSLALQDFSKCKKKKGLKTQALCACVCACACTCSAGGCLGATCSEFAHKSHFANSQFTPASWGSLHLSSASYPRPSASLLSWSSLMELVLMERALKSQHEQPAQKLRKQPPPGQAGRSKAAQHHWHLPRLWLV